MLRNELTDVIREEVRLELTPELTTTLREVLAQEIQSEQRQQSEEVAARHQEIDQLWEEYHSYYDPLLTDFYEGTFRPTPTTVTSRGYNNALEFDLNQPPFNSRWNHFEEATLYPVLSVQLTSGKNHSSSLRKQLA